MAMPAPPSKKLTHTDYMVGWLCPLQIEQLAATIMLDEVHEKLPQPSTDHNVYTLGTVHGHNVVIAGMPTTGNTSSAAVATQMRSTFPNMKFGLLVGIGGAVPTSTDEGPIRLGHVVVSKPVGAESGAVQYDHGKAEVGNFKRTSLIPPPPAVLLNATQKLGVDRDNQEVDPLIANLRRIKPTRGHRKLKWPGSEKDICFAAACVHKGAQKTPCAEAHCDMNGTIARRKRDDLDESGNLEFLVVHRGTVACGEMVIKNGVLRDKMAARGDGIICFEMEAAGALSDFPCLVVRGISDYCDSHKNDDWHGFAALAAASYARELFNYFPIEDVQTCVVDRADLSYVIDDAMERNVKEWLAPPDSSISFEAARHKNLSGTGQWLLTHQAYAGWRDTPGSFFWINGRSGAGKTVLSSTIIEDCSTRKKPHSGVAYFYFEHQDNAKHELSQFLKSIIFQLCMPQSSPGWTVLRTHYDQDRQHRHSEHPSTDDLLSIFRGMCESTVYSDGIYLILDALDEIPRNTSARSKMLSWLAGLAEERQSHLHVAMTSRDELDLRDRLPAVKDSERLYMDSRAFNEADIASYVQHKLYHDPDWKFCRSQKALLSEIERTLVRKADGMFRWVDCQLQLLQSHRSEEKLRSALNALPDSLEGTYHLLLQRIQPIDLEQVLLLFQVLLLTDCPIRLREANDIISISLSHGNFDPSRRLFDARHLLDMSWNLLLVRESVDARESQVTFAHSSVREFLTSPQLSETIQHRFTPENTKVDVVRACLIYLASIHILSKNQSVNRDRPWLERAGETWREHVHEAETSNDVVCRQNVVFVTTCTTTMWILLIPRHVDELYPTPYRTDMTRAVPLRLEAYVAAWGGMIDHMRRILERWTEVKFSIRIDAQELFCVPSRQPLLSKMST